MILKYMKRKRLLSVTAVLKGCCQGAVDDRPALLLQRHYGTQLFSSSWKHWPARHVLTLSQARRAPLVYLLKYITKKSCFVFVFKSKHQRTTSSLCTESILSLWLITIPLKSCFFLKCVYYFSIL